ncbi:MAG: hypothetical protein WCT99_12225 [Bacteroidota bacterium]|jgi:hypothetical protein
MKTSARFIFIILCAGLLVQQGFSQRTIRMNLERIVSDAAVIVHGTVAAVEAKRDPGTNIISTVVTIRVIENFYGAAGDSITLKMAGGRVQNRSVRFSEMPVFTPGEEFIGMFYAPSRLGLTSPVGMGQGKFRLIRDPAGTSMIVKNSLNNAGLFTGMKHASSLAKSSMLSASTQGIALDDFTASLRSLITIVKK